MLPSPTGAAVRLLPPVVYFRSVTSPSVSVTHTASTSSASAAGSDLSNSTAEARRTLSGAQDLGVVQPACR